MQVVLRYFHNPKTGEFVTSARSLAFAMKHRCEVKHIVHWQTRSVLNIRDRQIQALLDCARLLRGRLLTAFWSNCITIIWSLFAIALLWWLPIGLPTRWGWAAFLVLVALPWIVMALNFRSAIRMLVLGRRLSSFLGSMVDAKPIVAPYMACPTMLLTKQKGEPVKKWPALVSLVLLLVFMSARIAVPLRGFAVIVHDIGGGEFSTEEVHRLAPDEYWEYAPRFIRGTAYGMLYFEEGMSDVLVLSVDYILENTKLRSQEPVRDQIQIWMSNVAHFYSMTIKGEGVVDLDGEGVVQEIREGVESEPVQAALHETFKMVANRDLEERFTTLEFEVRWVSIDDYIKKVR